MAKVIRLYGKADSFDIEFSRKGEKWEVDIPPDITDGVYAVQLTAIDELGETAYWVGELYMCNGACCIKLEKDLFTSPFSIAKHKLSISPLSDIELSDNNFNCVFNESFDISFKVIRKECGHVR